MESMHTVPILFNFNQSLEMPAGVCLTSLLENAAADTFYDIFVLHDAASDFSGSKLAQLPSVYKNCRITFRAVKGEFDGAYEVRGIAKVCYYRLISPEYIPEYDKYLYSDVDVIFREDLRKYYEMDLGDNYFGAVSTYAQLRPDTYKNFLWRKMGINWRDGYFFDGNLSINAKKILEDNKLLEFKALGKNKYDEQDMTIMNIACKGRILSMPPSFCVCTVTYALLTLRREEMEALHGKEEVSHALSQGILHYNGKKPWNSPCPNADAWWAYYRKSIFFDEGFTADFWTRQRDSLVQLSLWKRIKVLFRYPLDRMAWRRTEWD